MSNGPLNRQPLVHGPTLRKQHRLFISKPLPGSIFQYLFSTVFPPSKVLQTILRRPATTAEDLEYVEWDGFFVALEYFWPEVYNKNQQIVCGMTILQSAPTIAE